MDDHIFDRAKHYLRYDMIEQHTDLPEYPAARTRLLYTFLRKCMEKHELSELYSLVASLIQMGLDTHDMVLNQAAAADERAMRSQQLKVLAGDYFSSRYYYLLAREGQIEAIRMLSQAIGEVNRLKMGFYLMMNQVKMTAEDYLRQMVGIKTEIFLSFTDFMKGSYQEIWPEVLANLTSCEVLVEELNRTGRPEDFRRSYGFFHILQHGTSEEGRYLADSGWDNGRWRSLINKYNISGLLMSRIEGHLNKVKDALGKNFPDSDLFETLASPFLQFLRTPKMAEEY